MTSNISSIHTIFEKQSENKYQIGCTTWEERVKKLKALERAIMHTYKQRIIEAMKDDFNKIEEETILSELFPISQEIKTAIRELSHWTSKHRVPTPLTLFGSKSYYTYQSKGVCLIISPWNFPFNLTFCPLVSAIAAGNTVIIKPSEITPNSASLIETIVKSIFDEKEIAVINGGPEVAQELLKQPFNHIFFTGSPAIGKIVMKAAAEHLTSVTLELGGKSPTIIDSTADLDLAAQKVVWGKLINAGQICIAPDYVLIQAERQDKFIDACKKQMIALNPDQSDQTFIVNAKHFSRIKGYLDDALEKGGKIETLGSIKNDVNNLAPTIISQILPNEMDVMTNEIFGPLLPIIPFATIKDAVQFVQQRETPLSLYIFSKDKGNIDYILNHTRSGGTVVNQVMLHFYNGDLPFGGEGNSGQGRSHGFAGFKEFSVSRSVVKQKFGGVPSLLVPPYPKWKKKMIALALKYL